jgi:hypothetical protein
MYEEDLWVSFVQGVDEEGISFEGEFSGETYHHSKIG